MRELQRITVTGRNWNDIIKLPCFRELANYGSWSLLISGRYVNGREVGCEDAYYGIKAEVGDTLVEYEDQGWGIIRA